MGPLPDPLFDLLRPERPTAIVDIGASPLDKADPPYKPLLAKRLCRLVGFEPQAAMLAALEANKGECETYLPYVVGDGNDATLYVSREPGMTSLLRLDPRWTDLSRYVASRVLPLQEMPTQTRRLDDIAEIEFLDFLKIDVQGSELTIFQNGRRRLADAVAIQTEVSFLQVYENQPVFGDVDLELRGQGFIPHAVVHIHKFMIPPLRSEKRRSINQLVEADFVYVRDWTRPEAMSSEQLKHLALIAHHCYQSFDLALFCLQQLETRQILSPPASRRYLAITQPDNPH
jgi:FkbM family methyltransferase